MLVPILLKYENMLVLLCQKEENDAITYCARGGTTCKSSQHLAGHSSPRCRPPSPSPDSGSPEAFYYVRLWGWMEEAFSKILKLCCPVTCIPASRHSLNHWMNLSSPEKEKRVRVALSAPSSSGQLCQWGLLWLLEWRLSDIRYPRSKPSFASLHCWLCSGNA